MPTYVVLGATGGMGSAIVRSLLKFNDTNLQLTLHVMVRSKPKLHDKFPTIEQNKNSNFAVRIFEGAISDTEALRKCLDGASTIYVCVGTNTPAHHIDIARSTARAVIDCLRYLKEANRQPEFTLPIVVINRSMGVATDTRLPSAAASAFFRFLAPSVLGDVSEAAVLYQEAAKKSLLRYIIVDAPGLQDPTGSECTGHELFLEGPGTMSVNYADAGAAFVEASQRQGEFVGKAVGIRATGEVRASRAGFLPFIVRGLWVRLTPFL